MQPSRRGLISKPSFYSILQNKLNYVANDMHFELFLVGL